MELAKIHDGKAISNKYSLSSLRKVAIVSEDLIVTDQQKLLEAPYTLHFTV